MSFSASGQTPDVNAPPARSLSASLRRAARKPASPPPQSVPRPAIPAALSSGRRGRRRPRTLGVDQRGGGRSQIRDISGLTAGCAPADKGAGPRRRRSDRPGSQEPQYHEFNHAEEKTKSDRRQQSDEPRQISRCEHARPEHHNHCWPGQAHRRSRAQASPQWLFLSSPETRSAIGL